MLDMFLSPNAQWVLLSALTLGIASGMVGCLAYWKRQSLMSDALSHAALPGVVIAFMIIGSKNLPFMVLGAAISAFAGAWLIQWIRSASRIKEDTAMGIVLSVFFGSGVMLLTKVSRMATGNQAGLDNFIFGQAASMIRADVYTMLSVALLVILIICIGFKEWKLFLFDANFAKGIGLSTRLMDSIYLVLLVLIIVIGIQAVGVILMAALLIIPAVSAHYWTHSFRSMLILSAIFGGGSGMLGALISAMGKGWPTGPFIVLAASSIFLISFIFGAQRGILIQAIQLRIQRKLHLEDSSPQQLSPAKGGETR
ncbi:metal ABC transporter permease [Lederbergia galactosidilytica]|uniref:Manganese transport system membrane protein MntC n=1 Tax=Lederbergia galactosidilytica TaxID=217031 RepID=A0A0Q9Y0U8_9BACI|nr:iron chelate uptake ABC transporter family permease subunit [Lederbergia galactosidilytica]KRG11130.1 manganese ABC transporter [Lederbergia galactosidilytica]OAK75788.1 manganese ABC transporter [Lederbergia galactosidilytica]